ncbi:ribosomal protein S18-alanine N-acetyltransferase [Kyrpidia spormannii]|uniref:Ribosomal-protein-alanine N-acetyltransferase n=1 Tax=Kyrpidia spormannii TaxID=2055160 RepID=A0ACA8Z506_9BACL|nr:Ribosomal-protein-alanine N-acetyltransferase [Kyrpidia spormannii]
MAGSSALIIRPMRTSDLDRIQEIERASFTVPWSRNAFYGELADNHFARYIVAQRGDLVVGYAGMWLILDEAHITNIAVHPEARRQHVGETLLRYAMAYARSQGAMRMTLEVRVSNAPAQHLYRKLGFTAKGVRRGYYTDNHEDAIIMWAELGQFDGRINPDEEAGAAAPGDAVPGAGGERSAEDRRGGRRPGDADEI